MVKRSKFVEYEKSYERKTTLGITFDTICSQEVKYGYKWDPISNFFVEYSYQRIFTWKVFSKIKKNMTHPLNDLFSSKKYIGTSINTPINISVIFGKRLKSGFSVAICFTKLRRPNQVLSWKNCKILDKPVSKPLRSDQVHFGFFFVADETYSERLFSRSDSD